MVWFCVWQVVVSTWFELISLGRKTASDKDLEILLLRRQLAIYERKQERAPHLSRGEKLTLVVLTTKLKTRDHPQSRDSRPDPTTAWYLTGTGTRVIPELAAPDDTLQRSVISV